MEVVRLTSWLWCLRTPLVQAYAVRHRDGFNLIDTGADGDEQAILQSLSAIGRTPLREVRVYEIVLTHGHDDHTGSAAGLVERTGARVLASTIDTPIIEGVQPAPEPQLADWEVALYERIHPAVPPARPVHVDVPVDNGANLEWDEVAHVIAAPGHTAGSIVVLFPRARVLVAGDAMAWHEGKPMLGVFNADPAQARDTFRSLAALNVDIACYGHGDPLLTGARTQLAHAAAQM